MYIEAQASPWLSHIQQTVTNASGTYSVEDKHGMQITLEWKKLGLQSPEFSAIMKSLSSFACEICSQNELEFFRATPEAITEDSFLKSSGAFLSDGAVDWPLVETTIRGMFKQLYEADLSRYPIEMIKPLLNDVYFFVIAKDPASGELLGFTTFAITPALPFGDIKLVHVVMREAEYERGLDQHLFNSILKLVPDAKRVFLGVRPTNEPALHSLRSLGFTPDTEIVQDPNHKFNPDHWALLEKRL